MVAHSTAPSKALVESGRVVPMTTSVAANPAASAAGDEGGRAGLGRVG
jgi:hypothetical protein